MPWSVFNEVPRLRPATLLKDRFHQENPREFSEISHYTPFLFNTSGRLLLKVAAINNVKKSSQLPVS